ncbi:Tetratricopeptide-like helical domain superfamily [Sesbania bispinosa]|nr:Tetratricopeptide-like helical domain superfamily [Sesbania bispinosa]
MRRSIRLRQFSTLIESHLKKPSTRTFLRSSLPIPHRTIPQPKEQDLDFVNVAHSHLIHSHWDKLKPLSTSLTPFRIKHILLKLNNNDVLSLEFFNWVHKHNPSYHTLETHSILLHTLTKNRKFKTTQSILRRILTPFLSKLFEALLYSYRFCDSSPLVFDALFKTFAHMNKLRNATDTFTRMKEYGFFPTVESCNAFLSSLLQLHRADVALSFYREMRRDCISPNVYTLNMVICAYCKLGELQKASETLEKMKDMGLSPNVVSYNGLISGYCNNNKGLLGLALKIKSLMGNNGVCPNVDTFNTLINGFCKEGKLHEANSELGIRLFEEMGRNQVKADILTYNALILGLCKDGKRKKAASLVKELDKENLVPNSSTFSALINGQFLRNNYERAFLIYRSMIGSGCSPNENTFQMLISAFCKNEDFDGAVQVLRDTLDRVITPDSSILSELYSGKLVPL